MTASTLPNHLPCLPTITRGAVPTPVEQLRSQADRKQWCTLIIAGCSLTAFGWSGAQWYRTSKPAWGAATLVMGGTGLAMVIEAWLSFRTTPDKQLASFFTAWRQQDQELATPRVFIKTFCTRSPTSPQDPSPMRIKPEFQPAFEKAGKALGVPAYQLALITIVDCSCLWLEQTPASAQANGDNEARAVIEGAMKAIANLQAMGPALGAALRSDSHTQDLLLDERIPRFLKWCRQYDHKTLISTLDPWLALLRQKNVSYDLGLEEEYPLLKGWSSMDEID